MSTKSKRISLSESLVMDALWESHPLSSSDIVELVAPEQGWQPGTVKTLLNRLLAKQAISAAKVGRRYLYSPVLERRDYVLQESQGLINRLFDGRVSELVAQFSKAETLDAQDISELKRLIHDLDDD